MHNSTDEFPEDEMNPEQDGQDGQEHAQDAQDNLSVNDPEAETCLFCEPQQMAPGIWRHADTCPSHEVKRRTRQMRDDAVRRAQQAKQQKQSNQQAPATPPTPQEQARQMRQRMRQAADGAASLARGDWPLTEGQAQQLREANDPANQARKRQEAEQRALTEAQAEEVYRKQQEREREAHARAKQQEYDATARRLLGETKAEAEERQALAGEPLPQWMQEYLRERGVPDAVFQEFRGAPLLPDLDKLAEQPAGAAPLPIPGIDLPEEVRATRAGLLALRKFFTDVDDQLVATMEGIESTLRNQYIESGAIYGPSEDGLWFWAGEMAEAQRCQTRLQRISQRQQSRRTVNQRFPHFWQGEWDVPTGELEQSFDPSKTKSGEPLPAPDGVEASADTGSVAGSTETTAEGTPATPPSPTLGGDVDTSWMD